jgi:hypothetical protein
MNEAFNDLLSAIDHDLFEYDSRQDRADIDICRFCKKEIIWFPVNGKDAMWNTNGGFHNCKESVSETSIS